MTAKEYLSQVKQLNQKIKQNLDEEKELRIQAETIHSFDYTKDRVQTSPQNEAPYAIILEKILTLDEEIGDETDRLVLLRRQITKEIQSLENSVYSDLLYRRYVKYEPLDTIAGEMEYDPVYVRSLHGLALDAFARKFGLDEN